LIIFHIIPSGQWEQAQQDGTYRGDTLDAEGFIHFSKIDQVLWVANGRFKGHTGLLLLEVETDKLIEDLKFEAPYEAVSGEASGWEFPHLYDELNLDAVVGVHDFEPEIDGTFRMPDTL
jgi:uncharacterized protein (DUF952 family)